MLVLAWPTVWRTMVWTCWCYATSCSVVEVKISLAKIFSSIFSVAVTNQRFISGRLDHLRGFISFPKSGLMFWCHYKKNTQNIHIMAYSEKIPKGSNCKYIQKINQDQNKTCTVQCIALCLKCSWSDKTCQLHRKHRSYNTCQGSFMLQRDVLFIFNSYLSFNMTWWKKIKACMADLLEDDLSIMFDAVGNLRLWAAI